MNRLTAQLLGACLLLVSAAEARGPNILLIVTDGQSLSELGCFGNPRIETPRLDRLAAEGVRLTNFYVASPACTSARASLLTGRYPQRHGLYDMIRNDLVDYGHQYSAAEYAVSPEMTLGLDVREVLVSQPLRQAGYACGTIGKWDIGRARRFLPLQRGFDFFYGFATSGIDYWTHERYGIPSMFRGNALVHESGYATDLFCGEAQSFISKHRDRPFFLHVAFNAPHPSSNLDREQRLPQAPPEAIAGYADVKSKSDRARYAAITCMDRCVGQLLDLLDSLKLADDTLVIFCSGFGRGGRGLAAPLNAGRTQMYDGALRAPLIARWPSKIPAGKSSHEFVTALELFPTVLAAAGVACPSDVKFDGFDMLPVLAGQPSPRSEMFWQLRNDKAARVDKYKWVASDAGSELYDLSDDEGEQRNLALVRTSEFAHLKERFAAWQREMNAAEPRDPFRDY